PTQVTQGVRLPRLEKSGVLVQVFGADATNKFISDPDIETFILSLDNRPKRPMHQRHKRGPHWPIVPGAVGGAAEKDDAPQTPGALHDRRDAIRKFQNDLRITCFLGLLRPGLFANCGLNGWRRL